MTTTLIRREVAGEARDFARQSGKTVGTRGRLSREHFVDYFLSRPRRAREVASALNIPVSRRGRLAEADAVKVAATVR
jgi:hypothetical protein